MLVLQLANVAIKVSLVKFKQSAFQLQIARFEKLFNPYLDEV